MNCVVVSAGVLPPPIDGFTPMASGINVAASPEEEAWAVVVPQLWQPAARVAVFLATPAGLHRLRQLRNTFGRLQKCWEPAVRCPVSDDTFLCGAFSPRMSGWIGTCVGVVARRSRLWTAGAGENQCRGTGGSIRDGGVACRCCLSLAVLILCVFACRHFAGGFW